MPEMPLAELLRLAYGAGYAWLRRPEGEATVAWAAGAVEETRPGDLLALPASAGRAALEDAERRGAAAALLLGEPPPGLELSGLRLPVAQTAAEDVPRRALQLLLTLLVDRRAGLLERAARLHAQLAQLAAAGGGLAGLARALAEISGRGALIQDKRLNILAESSSSTLHGIWEAVCAGIARSEALPASLEDRKQAGQQAAALRQELPGGLERLVAPIRVGGVARGYLSLAGLSGELDDLDTLIIEQGALVCAWEMARAKAVRETEKRLKGDLLEALLLESLAPRDARLWALDMGLDLEQAHAALRFSWRNREAPSRRRLETLVNGEIVRRRLPAIVSPIGSEVVVICQEAAATARPETALSLAWAVSRQAAQENPAQPVLSGAGRAVGSLEEWRVSFRQAGQALEMARRLGEAAPLYFPDLSVYRLLLQIEHSPELTQFFEETLGALAAHENSEEMQRTLEAYFENNGNLAQTSEALFVHRNTLAYRMERISSITGLDLSRPETRLAVQLALYIWKMTRER